MRIIHFRPAIGEAVDIELESLDADVKLFIRCGELAYKLGFTEVGIKGEEIKWMGEVSTDIMTASPPVGAPFTGMMFGLYAFGEMEPCLSPADFGWASFEA